MQVNRVAFLCHPYHRGGVTSWMAEAAAAFVHATYEVYFITVNPKRPFVSGMGRETMAALVTEQSPKVRLLVKEVDHTFELGTQEFRKNVYQSIIANELPLGTPIIVSDDDTVWQAAVGAWDGYPVIGVLHGNDDAYYSKAIKYDAHVDADVAVSGRIQRTLLEKGVAISPTKVTVIPCGIRLPTVEAVPATEDTCDIIKIVFIGRMEDDVKRPDDLFKLVAYLADNKIPAHLDIIGNSPESEVYYKSKYSHATRPELVSFKGWLAKKEIYEVLNRSDIVLLTSRSEGMPVVMMEGLSCGCGFVGTRVSGIEDFEHHQLAPRCFGVFEVGDIAMCADKIVAIGRVPRGVRRASARQLAEAEFDIAQCVHAYVELIKKLPARSFKRPNMPSSVLLGIISWCVATLRNWKLKVSKR